jgi:2-methylcitrate dehydratase PrpD
VARAFAPEDDDRSLAAQVAGNEVAGRLGAALLLGPHNGQFWSSIHCASGAVAAGVALELPAERLAHALAIALYQPNYGLWPGFMGPQSKLLTAAEPAVAGARAAMLAAEGVTGALDVVEHPRGLLRNFSYVPRPAMLRALGEVWLTDTLAYKPYPGCAYLQAAVAGALEAGVAADEIEAIDVDAGLLTTGMEELGAAAGLTPVGVTFSVARSVAVALIAGRLTHAELEPAWLAEHAGAIEPLAARVQVRHDWEQTLRTLEGPVQGGASVADVPVGAWPRVLRRMRELDGGGIGGGELVELLRDRRLRARFGRLLRRPERTGLGALDTEKLRMPFPARLRIRTRSGERIAIDGAERGAAGHPLAEQRAVVERKRALVDAGVRA